MNQPPNAPETPSGSLAESLRREFDETFSRPHRDQAGSVARLVVVRVGSEHFAVRIGELSGLQAISGITELPGAVPHRLGISGMGGKLVPIFDLAGLLERAKPNAAPRLVLLHGEETVGLACHDLLGQLLVPAGRVRPIEQAAGSASLTDAIVDTEDGAIPVLCVRRIVERIRQGNTHAKER